MLQQRKRMLLTEKVNNSVDKSVDIVDKLKKSDGKLYFSPDFLLCAQHGRTLMGESP